MPILSQSRYTLEGPEFRNGDLSQHSVKTRTFLLDLHGPTTTTCDLNLPLIILDSFWKRHNLSMSDVQKCIEFVPAQTIWLLALLHGIDLSSSSLKPSFADDTSILVSSKAIAVKKILRGLEHTFGPVDRITAGTPVNVHHVPHLPIHYVPTTVYDTFSRNIAPNLDIFSVNRVPTILEYLGLRWVPRQYEGAFVYCNRVATVEEFERSRKFIGRGLATRGYVVQPDDRQGRYVCTEESILMASQRGGGEGGEG